MAGPAALKRSAQPAAATGKVDKKRKVAAEPDPRFDTSHFSEEDDEDAPRPGESPACSDDPDDALDASGSGSDGDGTGEAEDDDDLLAALEEPGSDDGGAREDAQGQQAAAGPTGRPPDGQPGTSDSDDDEAKKTKQHKKKKVLAIEKVKRMAATAEKRGIVYISRIPPHMKPQKLRQLLAEHGELGRVYCAPEDPALRRLRKQNKGNTGKNFTEGWVEFDDKRRAKRAALLLNGQPMGGRHRSAYRFDLWNIKYLSKFKWDHLTEEVAYQRAVREQKLAAEIRAAKRERDFYLSRVDRAKGIAAQEQRRAAKAGGTGPAAPVKAAAAGGGGEGGGEGRNNERHYGQRRPKTDPTHTNAPEMSKDVLMMLGAKGSKKGTSR